MRFSLLVINLFIILSVQGAVAEALPFNFVHYNTRTGLPSNCIRDIVRDTEGYMWFATDGGVVRFDGNRSEIFLPETSSDTYAETLALWGGDIIVGMSRGLYRYRPGSKGLEPVEIASGEKMPRPEQDAVKALAVDAEGNLWVSVMDKGLYKISKEQIAVEHHSFPELDNYVPNLSADTQGNVWVVSTAVTNGLWRMHPNGKAFVHTTLTVGGRPASLECSKIFRDSEGQTWLATRNDGLFRLDTSDGSLTPIAGSETLKQIHSLAQYSSSQLLVGSAQGLTLIDKYTGQSRNYTKDELNTRSLSDMFVYPIVKDPEGGVWVGTFYGGVNYLPPDTKKIRSHTHSKFVNSVSGNVISCFAEDNRGDIWVGSDDGGLCRYEPASGNFKHFKLNSLDNVHAICTHDSRIWVGTYGEGVSLLDPQTGGSGRIPFQDNSNYDCYALARDGKGGIWAGIGNVLANFDAAKNTFVPLRDLGAWIVNIATDNDGRIWISTQGEGIYLFNPAYGTWQRFINSGETPNLHNSEINKVLVTADGSVYAATVNGLEKFNATANRFEKVDLQLPSDAIQSIEAVGDNLWISTRAGLAVRHNDGSTRVLTTHDGLADDEFSAGASLATSSGRIFLGTVNGMNIINPADVRFNEFTPPVCISRIELNRSDDTETEVLFPAKGDALTIDPDVTSFTLWLAALSYADPNRNRFMYRLEGFDKDWIEAGPNPRVTYSNLPAGKYTLRVKAANNDGVWNQEGVSLSIQVQPVWYATWWMRLIYLTDFIAMMGCGFAIVQKRRERRYERQLQQVTHNQERESFRTKLNFFTIVAHEIRTPVSLIIGPLEKIRNSFPSMPTALRHELEMIDRNAQRLLTLVNQMLDYQKVEASEFTDNLQRLEITPLIEGIAERFRPTMSGTGITLTVECPAAGTTADIYPESFTKMVSNLLNNARKFTRDQITLTCTVADSTGLLTLTVADNGPGIKHENRDKVFKPFFQIEQNPNDSRGGTGLGLTIVSKVVQRHQGEISIGGEYGSGAVFTVTIPSRVDDSLTANNPRPEIDKDVMPQPMPETADGDLPVMLVVDDEEEMRTFIAMAMAGRYRVLTASNGAEGLEILRKNLVAVVVCDWMMPVMDGLTMLRQLRADTALNHIPFLMLTAKTDIYSKVESMKEGADAYVEKPFSLSFLTARLDNLIDIRRMLRKKYETNPLEPVTTLAARPEEDVFLTRLTDIVKANFTNPDLGVDFLAHQLGLSRTNLYAKVRALADMTPNEIIQITRLKAAAELLAKGDYRVSEVSETVGFNSPSYFSKCFIKQFGVKPVEFK